MPCPTQVSALEGEEATQRAMAIISAAPPDDARRMARMVLSAVDAADHGRFAEKFIELNLALGNTGAAIAAAADAAVAEQRRGEYKVLRRVPLTELHVTSINSNLVPCVCNVFKPSESDGFHVPPAPRQFTSCKHGCR
jgi:hypothetical protein